MLTIFDDNYYQYRRSRYYCYSLEVMNILVVYFYFYFCYRNVASSHKFITAYATTVVFYSGRIL